MTISFWSGLKRAFISFLISFGRASIKAFGLLMAMEGIYMYYRGAISPSYNASISFHNEGSLYIFLGGLILFWKSRRK